jgi:hypothetical protein
VVQQLSTKIRFIDKYVRYGFLPEIRMLASDRIGPPLIDDLLKAQDATKR